MHPAAVVVWSSWQLHADAVAAVLADGGVQVEQLDDPCTTPALLVVGIDVPDHTLVLSSRRTQGYQTVVWGGTLPTPRVDALRAVGATAYVDMLQPVGELVEVVRRVLAGQEVSWPPGPGPLPSLTQREHEVAVAYLVRWADHPRSEVAEHLGMSERTLKVHIANIRAKAGHRGTATRDGLLRTLTVRGWIG